MPPAARFAAVASLIAISFLITPALRAQTQSAVVASPRFEVASIKPTDPSFAGVQIQMLPTDSRVTVQGLTLKDLIRFAYSPTLLMLAPSLVSGGPNWYDRDRYDIVAKPEGQRVPSQGERKLMLRTLLEERFNLKYHRESKETAVFALVVAKNGPKMKESKPEEVNAKSSAVTVSGLSGRHASMGLLVDYLQRTLQLDPLAGLPVIDRSGLTGRFDFEFTWATGETQPNGRPLVDAGSVSNALREQLGLELNLTKAPVEAIVVDHAEKPSEN